MKGMRVQVYWPADGHQSTNGGISSTVSRITIIGEGVPQRDEPSADAPAFKLVIRDIFGTPYKHLEPVERPDPGNAGWMMGGNYASWTGNGFPNLYPIPIHDRQETPEQFEMMSN